MCLYIGTHIGLVGVGFDFTSFDPQPTGFDGVMQFDNFFFEHTDIQVPEPSALAPFAFGLSGLRLLRRRVCRRPRG